MLDYLVTNHTHPTVDEIYNNLIGQLPTLSKTTVYNTVKSFVDKNIIRQINVDSSEDRYDIILEDHGHFKCNECGKIYNFKINRNTSHQELEGFDINYYNICLKGTCKDCLEKKKKS
ncbi:MAG: transcriptional repressor [Finegoldia sp.]|nr:transcriptional repressor [Finegoldia sp.]